MLTPEIQKLVAENAVLFSLPEWLIVAVINTESGGDPWAVRFEAAFRAHYVPDQCQVFGASHETERTTRACSWGLMQIMGQVAREHGYVGPIPQLCDPAVGLYWGCVKLRKCLDLANQDVHAALQRYNGGSNPDYSAQVMSRMIHYKGVV